MIRRRQGRCVLLTPVLVFALGLSTGVFLPAGRARAADAGLVLHLQPLGGCGDGPADATMACAAVDAVGDGSLFQSAWVIAFGWESLPGWPEGRGISGVQFGIEYDPGVTILGWALCTGGSHLPQDSPLLGTWPESHTALAATWGAEYQEPNGFARIGYLILAPGSQGRLGIIPDLRLQPPSALAVSGGLPPIELAVPREGLSGADAGGTNPANALISCQEGVPAREVSWGRVKSGFR